MAPSEIDLIHLYVSVCYTNRLDMQLLKKACKCFDDQHPQMMQAESQSVHHA